MRRYFFLIVAGLVFSWVRMAAPAAEIKLLAKPHDPYGSPRPFPGQKNVPLGTSFLVELGFGNAAAADAIVPESVGIELESQNQPPLAILRPGPQPSQGYSSRFLTGQNRQGGPTLIVYVDSERPLLPSTNYTLRLTARSRQGAVLSPKDGTWQFTTEEAPRVWPLSFNLPQKPPLVRWHGSFFTGFCSTGFCTSTANRIPTYQLMEQVRKSAPRAWSLQRDFWMTGMEHQPAFLSGNLPNLVRERETRRIVALDKHPGGTLLRVEDFLGHQQYGIPSGRPVSEDFRPGDEVLIGDGVHDARTRVIRADDGQRAILVNATPNPAPGWKIAYAAIPLRRENPDAPGIFPPGGCYLRKFRPAGTPVYYWGRLDREWDLAHKRYRRRLMPNFADAPGDLAVDGRNWTTAKDYVELHEATRTITGHILQRYGPDALDFTWSVFNEPDLGVLFWRSDWNELQKFYDYTVDAILRAFEDHGYDSRRVFVGGLELAGIFGTNLRLREFLSHCSPRAQAPGALAGNAAYADPRLQGKRSKRVEELCRAHGGRGSPCDFISIHAYNRSQLMADKLIRAKEMALEIDADYFARLWVNSHESCPEWNVPSDPAYHDSYLGNGYFPTWCADVARRQLQRAAIDPRFAYGESILTFWAWPSRNFEGRNDCVRAIQVDDNGDGKADRTVTVAMPILHFLGLLSRMGPEYYVFPEQTVGGHVLSGIASPNKDKTLVLLYSHHALDTESRSAVEFDITLRLAGLPPGPVGVEEFRFDQDHNSYFRLGRQLRDQAIPRALDPGQLVQLQETIRQIEGDSRSEQLKGLKRLAEIGPAAAQAASGPVFRLIQKSPDAAVRGKATELLLGLNAPPAYPAATVRKVEDLATLRATNTTVHRVKDDGRLEVKLRLAGNGANWLSIQRESDP